MKENEELRYIKDNLRREDLSPVQQDLYDVIGIEKYLELCDSFGGSAITLCKLETLRKTIAKRLILEDRDLYDSGMVRITQLAKIHSVCESTVYNILREGRK